MKVTAVRRKDVRKVLMLTHSLRGTEYCFGVHAWRFALARPRASAKRKPESAGRPVHIVTIELGRFLAPNANQNHRQHRERGDGDQLARDLVQVVFAEVLSEVQGIDQISRGKHQQE